MKTLKIKLSNEINDKIKSGSIRTVEVIEYILNNIPGATTTKDAFDTALKDISFNGKYAKAGNFDTWNNELILKF